MFPKRATELLISKFFVQIGTFQQLWNKKRYMYLNWDAMKITKHQKWFLNTSGILTRNRMTTVRIKTLIPFMRGVFDTTLCDKVCQWLEAGCWFSPGSPVSSTNKTDLHDIAEIFLNVALNTLTLTVSLIRVVFWWTCW
jgi:hypothetical protein